MTRPLISVCIPVYNGSKYLEDCLASVRAQTYENLEILLVDDCSSDASMDIIKKVQSTDDRIRYILNEKNIGLVENWKKCIDQAKGEWIKLFFQDDLMETNCIEKMFNACITNGVQFALCARNFIIERSASDRLKNFFEKEVYRPETAFNTPTILEEKKLLDIAKNSLLSNFLGEPIVVFFKKTIIAEIGNFKPGMPQLVDYEFILRAVLNVRSYFIPEKLVSFRVHSGAESDKQYESDKKRIAVELIEPMVLFHEYLFDKRLSKIRGVFGFSRLFRNAVSVYRRKALFYPRRMIKENFRPLYPSFKHLSLILFIAENSLLFKRIRYKYFG